MNAKTITPANFPARVRAALLGTTLALAAAAPAHAHSTIGVQIGIGIPAPVAVAPAPVAYAAPYPGWVWAPGYWGWVNARHVWVSGRWVAGPAPRYWAPVHYAPPPHGHAFGHGGWEREHFRGGNPHYGR